MRELPKHWEMRPLSELVRLDKPIVYGIVQAGPHFAEGVPYIRSSDVGAEIDISCLARTSPDIASRYRRSIVGPGDIVFSLRGNIGELSIVPPSLSEANLTQGTARIAVNSDTNNEYLAYALRSSAVQKRIAAVGKGSTFKEISLEELRKLEIPTPPLEEQIKIADVLRAWDEALSALNSLRALNLRRSTWLRTAVLCGTVRLPGFSSDWKTVPLKAVLKEHGLKSDGTEKVFSVSVHKGLVNQIEHLGRSFAASNTRHYNRVLPGDVVYTKSPTGEFPLGIIKQSRLDHEVIVSPLYGVFSPCNDAVGTIIDAYFQSPTTVRNYLHPLVQKGAKNTISISNDRFLEGHLRLPVDPSEQIAIARIVETSRAELIGLEKEIEYLTQQKRGLMQKLLSGEWRLEVDKKAAVA